jgi:hypothetical protein
MAVGRNSEDRPPFRSKSNMELPSFVFMVKNLTVREIYNFITGDFRACWDSLANNSDPTINRGNFMFGRQAMNLPEFACRLYQSDSSGQARIDFSSELNSIESQYFITFTNYFYQTIHSAPLWKH